MNNKLSISAIIPVYNGERYLGQTIESVLAQSFPVHEILVVDDGSTDRSLAIASQFPQVTPIQNSHQGAPASRNLGLARASGNWIAFLDADDLWMPTKIERQVQAILDQPSTDLIFTHLQCFVSPDLEPEAKTRLYCPPSPVVGHNATTMMARHSVFQTVGNFNECLTAGEFVEWLIRAQDASLKSLTLPDVLAKRRLHKTNVGLTNREDRNQYLHAIKASLDRRRAGDRMSSSNTLPEQ